MDSLNCICRICLNEITGGYPIFEKYDEEMTLATIINQYVNTQIIQLDNLPNMICESCTDILIQFHNLVITHENSTQKLKQFIESCTYPFELLNDAGNPPPKYESNPKFYKENQEEPVEQEITYPCNECSSIFKTEIQLNKHKNFHTNNVKKKKYICDVCGKICSKEFDLRDHMDSHSTENKYTCNKCGKKLKSRTSLLRHIKAHTFKNRYMCEVCGKNFTHHSSLKTHNILVHVRTKNHQCIICKQTFSLKSTLQRHMDRHRQRECDSERKYECDECNMKYYDNSSLKRHILTKHGDGGMKYKCDMCENFFSTKGNLARHKRTTHINVVVIEGIDYEIMNQNNTLV